MFTDVLSRPARSETVDSTLTVSHTGYGATDDVVLGDPIPAGMRVGQITAADPDSPQIAPWQECTTTGQDTDGSSATVDCVLDGWTGYDQSAPVVTVTAALNPEAGARSPDNVADVSWSGPDTPAEPRQTTSNTASVMVVLSAQEILAPTGFDNRPSRLRH